MHKDFSDYKRHKRFADAFYVSGEWKRCRAGYIKQIIWCERCAARGLTVPGVEVHHKIKLTPDNIKDPSIALNWDNLELLCKECHLAEHNKKRYRVAPDGHIDLPPI